MVKQKKSDRVACVMASGGVTGMAYEVGALRALDHAMVERTVNSFDTYVGTSAGAIVASFAAAGITSATQAQALAGTLPGFPNLDRWRIYRPNVAEAGSRLRSAVGYAAAATWRSWSGREPWPGAGPPSLPSLLPSGLFTTSGLEAYVRQSLEIAGIPDMLGSIRADLQLVATELETASRVAFSPGSHGGVPISKAVAASAAIPALFRPVEIDRRRYVDGAVTGRAGIDLAVQRGAGLVVVINGLVPLNTAELAARSMNGGLRSTVYDRGLRGVQNQVRRESQHEDLLSQLRMLEKAHPEVDFVLIEPRPDDEKMPFHQLMSFRARMIVMQHGYESVAAGLLAGWDHVAEVFSEHGIRLDDGLLRRPDVSIPVADLADRGSLIRRLRRTALDRRLRARGGEAARQSLEPAGAVPA